MLVLFFIMGIMVKLCDIEGTNTIHSLLDPKIVAMDFCFTLVGVTTTSVVAWMIFCAGLLVVLVPLGMFVQNLALSQKIPILRDAHTMEPPELLLGEDERYHLFLCPSHLTQTRTKPLDPVQPRIPNAPSPVVAGATFGAPGKTSAPSSSASCSCCYLASLYSSTLTTSVRLAPRTREPHAIEE